MKFALIGAAAVATTAFVTPALAQAVIVPIAGAGNGHHQIRYATAAIDLGFTRYSFRTVLAVSTSASDTS
jgi:hypothetical protein